MRYEIMKLEQKEALACIQYIIKQIKKKGRSCKDRDEDFGKAE